MKTNCEAYIAPELQVLVIDETATIMTSVTGNSSTEDLTEETFTW